MLLRGRSVRNVWVDLDESYLKPVFGGKLRKHYGNLIENLEL